MRVVAVGAQGRGGSSGGGVRVLAERLESRGGGGRVRVGVVELMLHGSRGGGVFHLEVGIRGIGPIFLVKRRDGSAGAAGWSRRLGRRWKRRVLVRGFEVSDTLFQVAEVVDAGLENGQLVHLLVFACRYHILQYAELFIHLGSSPSLDQTVSSLPCDLPSRHTS